MANKFTGSERVYYPKCFVQMTLIHEDMDADSTKTYVVTKTPLDLNIEKNNYNQADSFSFTLDAKDFPVHPNIIRTGNVKIWLFDSGSTEPVNEKTLSPNDESYIFSGVIDDIDFVDGSSGSAITVQGQDFTALLIERRYRDARDRKRSRGKRGERIYKNRVVNSNRLDGALKQMLLDAGIGNVRFENRTDFDPLPRVGKGSTATSSKRGFPVKDDATYWDVMTQLAGRHGFILYVEKNSLVLGRPLKAVKGVPIPIYHMIWGDNLSEYSVSRKMGKERTPRIRVVSYDDKKKKVVSATYPKNKKQIATSGVGTKYDEIQVKRVNGVADTDNLLRLAENYYNIVARGESTTKIKTEDLLDSNGKNLANISAGNLMRVEISPFHLDRLDSTGSFQARYARLLSAGVSPKAAGLLASVEPSTLLKPLYVKSASVSWDINSGVSLGFELIQLIDFNKGEDVDKEPSRRNNARKRQR